MTVTEAGHCDGARGVAWGDEAATIEGHGAVAGNGAVVDVEGGAAARSKYIWRAM